MEKITLEELTERITSGEKIIKGVTLVGDKRWQRGNGLIKTFSYLRDNYNPDKLLSITNSDLSGLRIDEGNRNLSFDVGIIGLKLSNVNLSDTLFRGVCFNESDWEEVYCNNTNLNRVYFNGKLRGVCFNGAELKDVGFEGNARYLEFINLDEVSFDSNFEKVSFEKAILDEFTLSQLMKVFNRFD